MVRILDSILCEARRLGASDVHLVRGVAPAMRIAGEIRSVEGPLLNEAILQEMLNEIATGTQIERLQTERHLCLSREHAETGRARFSIYVRSGCPEMAIRLGETSIRSSVALNLPPVVEELTRLTRGLVLVTGPTGVGKTTTLNYMIDVINRTRRAKIVTIEDPIEYAHQSAQSLVVQQEVASDVLSFRSALFHALRQDPDVIVIGEMRDLETIETALIAAETGHLVLATLHTPDAVQTAQRIFSVFPAEQQHGIVVQLANSLQAIVSQKLLPKADGTSQVLACEVCIATTGVRAHIRERQVHHIYNEMQTGRKFHMQTMDQALVLLARKALPS